MPKFKVGDKVKITGCFHGHGFDLGDIVTICVVNCGDYKAEKGTSSWWVMEDEIVLYQKKLKPLGDTIRGDGEFITKDSGQRVEFPDGMVRDISTDKTRYDLIPTFMLKRWADLLQRGAKKYGERNWEKAETQEALYRFKESAIRHMYQWLDGDTSEDHASAILFNVAGAEMVLKKLNGNKN